MALPLVPTPEATPVEQAEKPVQPPMDAQRTTASETQTDSNLPEGESKKLADTLRFEPVGATVGSSPPADSPEEPTADAAKNEEVPAPPSLSQELISEEKVQADEARKAVHRLQEEEKLKEIADKQQKELQKYNEEIAQKGSSEIAGRLQAASAAQNAKKWLSTTEGLEEGVIRSLNTMDVPPATAEQVLDRYGIKIMYKMLDGTDQGYNFLNQAKTSQGTYFNRVGRGMFQVFSFGQVAVSRMMQLEIDEMKRGGYDPSRSRVVEVEYGIIETTRGYDLGIKNMKVIPNVIGDTQKN